MAKKLEDQPQGGALQREESGFRPGMQFTEGEALITGCRALTGREAASKEEAIQLMAQMNFDVRMMKLGAKIAYATLVGRSMYGCRQSSQFIIERLFGQADKSFAEAANDLSHHEVLQALKQFYMSQGYDEKYAWELVERDRQNPMVALPAVIDVTPTAR